jgi:hypothetical protein
MNEIEFAAFVDEVEEDLKQFPVEPWVCAYFRPDHHEAALATQELQRRGHGVLIISVKGSPATRFGVDSGDGNEGTGPG